MISGHIIMSDVVSKHCVIKMSLVLCYYVILFILYLFIHFYLNINGQFEPLKIQEFEICLISSFLKDD